MFAYMKWDVFKRLKMFFFTGNFDAIFAAKLQEPLNVQDTVELPQKRIPLK